MPLVTGVGEAGKLPPGLEAAWGPMSPGAEEVDGPGPPPPELVVEFTVDGIVLSPGLPGVVVLPPKPLVTALVLFTTVLFVLLPAGLSKLDWVGGGLVL